jgi:hypothetical protein
MPAAAGYLQREAASKRRSRTLGDSYEVSPCRTGDAGACLCQRDQYSHFIGSFPITLSKSTSRSIVSRAGIVYPMMVMRPADSVMF